MQVGLRKQIYFNKDNLSRIETILPDKALAEIVNKCCAYVMAQDPNWIKQFIERQNISWIQK